MLTVLNRAMDFSKPIKRLQNSKILDGSKKDQNIILGRQ